MTTKATAALSAVIFLGVACATSAGPLPGIDVAKTCRDSERASFADSPATFDVCVSDEQAARARLVEDWAYVPARDKARCVLPTEYLPSYAEWLTCLEMERELRKCGRRNPTNDTLVCLTVDRLQDVNKSISPSAREGARLRWQILGQDMISLNKWRQP